MSTKQSVVYAPASIANLGPGFDVFGLALQEFGDTISLQITHEREISVSIQGIGAESIPNDANLNSASAVVQNVLKAKDLNLGFHIEIEKGVPPGIGLGSSGASAAAATHAVCKALGLRLSSKDYVKLAASGEAAVTGSPHADNVSASLLGGFTLVDSNYGVIRLDPPDMEIVIVIPEVNYRNKTQFARSLLPEKVQLKDAIFNVSSASKMAIGVALRDVKLFGESIGDLLAEPHRAKMIPNFWRVKQAALDAGAYGCSIAGGGPSLFAVGEDCPMIGKAMVNAFEEAEVKSEVILTRPSKEGVREI